jgi:S1-C subfamily serine protease
LHATIGIVSTRMDTERNGEPGYILHTDAVLYPGFSGGALVDMGGRTVGVTNRRLGRGKGVAIGTPVVRQVAEALLAHGRMRRGFLGVTTHTVVLPGGLPGKLSPGQERALVIVQIEKASPAEQAGLLIGDILLGLNDQAIEDADVLRRQLRTASPGDAVTVRILRGGELRDLPVTLGEVPV